MTAEEFVEIVERFVDARVALQRAKDRHLLNSGPGKSAAVCDLEETAEFLKSGLINAVTEIFI